MGTRAWANLVPVTSRLPTRPPLEPVRAGGLAPAGWRVEVSDRDPSTNATAAARARSGEPEGLVVVTEHQTRGRGRLDRAWETPARSSLTFSVLLRPDVPARRWPWLPLLTGYAVTQGLAAVGFDARLKWPNDVLLGGGKIAGILLERVETPGGPAAVLGIGLNVSQTTEELPVAHATSLFTATGEEPDRTALLGALLDALARGYAEWQASPDGGALPAAYRARCSTIGREVRVELPHAGPLTGTATGVDGDGRLLVTGPDGTVAVGAGDVVHVRPAQ